MFKSFLKAITSLGLARVVQMICGVASAAIIARALGPQGIGEFALARLLPLTIYTLLNLSLNSGIVHYTAKNKEQAAAILGTALKINLWITPVQLMLTIVIALLFGDTILKGISLELIVLASVLIYTANMFFSVFSAVLVGLGRFSELSKVAMLTAPFLPVIYLILWGTCGLTLRGALWTIWINALLTGILTWRLVVRHVGFPAFGANSVWKQFLSFSGICHAANVASYLNYRIDMYLVHYYLGVMSTGFYSTSVRIAERIWPISQVSSQVLFQRISSSNSERQRRRLTFYVASSVLLLTSIAGAILWIFAPSIILFLFGEKFLPTAYCLRWLLPGIIALSFGRIFANDLAGRGRPTANLYNGLLALSVNIAANIILIPRYGATGAAMATSISYTLATILCLLLYVFEVRRVKKA